jgi:hypothetical protein
VYAQLFCKAVAIGHAQLQRHKLLMKQFPKRTPYNCQQGIVIKPHSIFIVPSAAQYMLLHCL